MKQIMMTFSTTRGTTASVFHSGRCQAKPAMRKKRKLPVLGAISGFETLYTIFKKRAENVLDAELTWEEFHKVIHHDTADRYVRINPKTRGRTPRMDDKSQVHALHEEIRSGFSMHDMQAKIANIARRLVASSFYFDKAGPSRHSEGHIIVQGKR